MPDTAINFITASLNWHSQKGFFIMANRNRQHPIQLYLNDDEYKILKEKWKLSEMVSMSAFIRHLIIYGFVFDVDYSDLREYNAALGRIGNNLNQIAHRANINGLATNKDLLEAKELMEEIWHTQKSMLSKQPLIKQ